MFMLSHQAHASALAIWFATESQKYAARVPPTFGGQAAGPNPALGYVGRA